MERYSMFLDRKNQSWENDYTIKCNLQIQCDYHSITIELPFNELPFKLPMAFFTELEKKIHNSYGNTKDAK